MQADFSVELGPDDPTLTVPWSAPDGSLRFYDLRRQPDLLLFVEESIHYPELGEFLTRVNSERSLLQSAKCDVWFTTELGEDEQIYGARGKFGSYVDLFYSAPQPRASFADHEALAHRLTALLARAPELPSALDLLIRRGYFEESPGSQLHQGFYFSCYVLGYGDEEADARRHWSVALKLVENALLQLAARRPGRA
jgi:hypothetical protein